MKEGDVIEVSAPAGEFVLNENKNSPIVFNSGGVGQTPFISVLEHLKNTKSRRSITWVHGCRSRSVHAFKTLVDCTEITHCIIDRKYFYNSLDHTAKDSNCFQGIVDLKKMILRYNKELNFTFVGLLLSSKNNTRIYYPWM